MFKRPAGFVDMKYWTVFSLICAIGISEPQHFLPENGVMLELHRIAANHNYCSCQFADKQAERGYYHENDVILCMK